MKLERRQGETARRAEMRRALAPLCGGCSDTTAPCAAGCPRGRPVDCSPYCPEVPRALSSDPADQPLEAGIAPLVYELKRLKAFHPFWSCEGHDLPGARPWKTPRVWFYADSVHHVRVLVDCLETLFQDGKLATRWQVSATFCEQDNPDAAFALEPRAENGAVPALARLNDDVRAITEALATTMMARLRDLQAGG